MSSLPHTGFHSTSFPFSLAGAVGFILDLLYINSPLPSSPITRRIVAKRYRNQEIRERYALGETLAEIAEDYGISEQRIHEIVRYRS